MLKSSALVPETTLDLCCGGKKCPVIRDLGDAGFVIEDPDQTDRPIRLTRAQAAVVAPWLTLRLDQ